MTYTLDEVDRQIIARLQRNGRMPNVEIARDLGLSEGTVRKRLEKLLATGIIHIKAVVHPGRLGLTTPVLIGIQVDLAHLDEATRQLAAIPEVYSVKVVTGAYDVIVEAILPSREGLLPFLTARIAAIPGIRRTDTCHVLEIVKWACDSPLLDGFVTVRPPET